MTMTLSVHESITPNGASEHLNYFRRAEQVRPQSGEVERDEFHLLRDKLKVPAEDDFVERPRIKAILQKSLGHFAATLISGRAGTGKTAIAVALATETDNVVWYTVESTDVEWGSFSRYFSAVLSGSESDSVVGRPQSGRKNDVGDGELASFLLRSFARKYSTGHASPSLIVLDDIHHIFDATWFETFFNLLLYSLPSETHLLLLSRSRPPGPLWRLRSKQMLNVLDENVIAFNSEETESLFGALRQPVSNAAAARQACFGRVSKLLQYCHSRATDTM